MECSLFQKVIYLLTQASLKSDVLNHCSTTKRLNGLYSGIVHNITATHDNSSGSTKDPTRTNLFIA